MNYETIGTVMENIVQLIDSSNTDEEPIPVKEKEDKYNKMEFSLNGKQIVLLNISDYEYAVNKLESSISDLDKLSNIMPQLCAVSDLRDSAIKLRNLIQEFKEKELCTCGKPLMGAIICINENCPKCTETR